MVHLPFRNRDRPRAAQALNLAPSTRVIPRVAAVAAVLAGSTVLVGWGFNSDLLKSLQPGRVAMNPVTALAFILIGVSLWVFVEPPTRSGTRLVRMCGTVVALVGLVKLCDIYLGADSGVDRMIFREALERVTAGQRNRMAPTTALNLALVGFALVALHARTDRAYVPAQALLIVSAFISLVCVLGYTYGISSFYSIGPFMPMALPTAITFLMVGIGICFARPDRGVAALMRDEGVAGITARRLLPAAILLPASLGWLRLVGQRRGLYDSEMGMALLVVANILVFAVLVWWSAVLLRRADAGRLQRERELSNSNDLLRDEMAARSRVQEALHEAGLRERAMIAHAIDMICSIDAEGRFASVSPSCLKLLGYRPEELIGRAFSDLVAPEDLPPSLAAAADVMAGKEVHNFENRYRHSGGGFVDVVWTAHWSEADRLMFCVAHDNTERKRAEAALQDSRDYLDRIINAVADPIFVKDRRHRWVLVNDAFCGLIRRDRTGLIGCCDHDLFAKAQADVFLHSDELVFNGAEGNANEEALTDASGDTRVILTSKRLYVDKEGHQFIVGVIRDITDRKRMESELEATRDLALESVRLKAEFLANMSHEIRTPMNGVIGMTDLLLDTELSETQRDYADTIRVSAEALLTIINDILDFSKSEAGKLRFEKIPFDLHDAIHAPVEMLASRAHAKDLRLACFVHNDAPTALRGDPGRLRQIVTNLVGNAIKFTERGEIAVTVTREAGGDQQVTLRFEISDTGIGISEDARRLLFRPFTQADGSTTRKYGGTGLGLAIAKQLVELMGGEIGVDSAPGGGATFWFTARLDVQQGAPAAGGPSLDATSLEGLRVLIVDDNPTNRRILLHQTSSWGMAATEAQSGAEALASLREAASSGYPFQVAILDLLMPDMDGFELASTIKHDQAIANVRLVLLPAIGKRGHGEAARRAGIAAYLEKPVRQSQLHACLVTLMASASQEPSASSTLVTRHSLREVATAPDPPVQPSARHILVADDLAVNRKVTSAQLHRFGYQAHCVSNGHEALAALASHDYELVLMDCQMPEMDGFDASMEIRRREGTRRHTTIIAMTASALAGDRERCLAAGMDDYITKPVKSAVLRKVLERWLEPAVGAPSAS